MDHFENLYESGEYEELLKVSEQNLDDLQAQYWQLTALDKLGKFDQALDYSKSYEQNLGEMDDKWRGKLLHRVGVIYWNKGELDTALDYQKRSYQIFEELDDPGDLAESLNHIGIIFWNKGKLDKALQNLEKSLQLRKQTDNTQKIASSLNNIGVIFRNKGELEKALDYQQRSLDLFEEIDNSFLIAASLNNIGEIYIVRGELDKAIKHLKRSLQLFEQIDNKQHIAEVLKNLTFVYLINDQRDEAKQFVERLNALSRSHPDNKFIKLDRDYAQAIFLKFSNRNREKVRAQMIFEEIIESNDFDFEVLIDSLNHLVELLIYEYKLYNEEQVLEEILEHIDTMYQVAAEQNMFPTLLEVLILRSRLAMVRDKFDDAHEFIREAIRIAKEKNMETYLSKLENEKEELENDLFELKNKLETSSVASRIEQSKIEDYIQRIQRSRG